MAAVTASTMQGEKAKRITPNDSLRRATGSNPRPARVRMTVRATALCMTNTTALHSCCTIISNILFKFNQARLKKLQTTVTVTSVT